MAQRKGVEFVPVGVCARLVMRIRQGLRALNKKSWRSWRSSTQRLEKQRFISPPMKTAKQPLGGLKEDRQPTRWRSSLAVF